MGGGNNEEDDKPTTMLNIEELKKQSDFEGTGVSQLLEFSATSDIQIKPSCILFDLNSNFFAENKAIFAQVAKCTLVGDLKELNKLIVENKTGTFLFYFNDAGKKINALLAQINKKFPNLNTILIAKNLSQTKAQQHAKTPSRAKNYLSWPSDLAQIKRALTGNL